jgi:hypothetical protein
MSTELTKPERGPAAKIPGLIKPATNSKVSAKTRAFGLADAEGLAGSCEDGKSERERGAINR